MNDFIGHFKKHHNNEVLKIKIPLHDSGIKRRYSLMNYQTRLCDLEEYMLEFDEKFNLRGVNVQSPGAKKQN